jgi:hypothetical protein
MQALGYQVRVIYPCSIFKFITGFVTIVTQRMSLVE